MRDTATAASERPIRYVGDISRGDAALLAEMARSSVRILEYGVGASTQIFAQAAGGAEIVSLDRDAGWIERTRAILEEVAPGHRVRLQLFERLSVLDAFEGEHFDLVFDDGEAELRLEFGLAAWRLLPVGGRLVLHDTRRPRDAGNAMAIATRHFREVGRIDVNPGDSNLTILHKEAHKPAVNWNTVERRRSWQVGDDDLEETLARLRAERTRAD